MRRGTARRALQTGTAPRGLPPFSRHSRISLECDRLRRVYCAEPAVGLSNFKRFGNMAVSNCRTSFRNIIFSGLLVFAAVFAGHVGGRFLESTPSEPTYRYLLKVSPHEDCLSGEPFTGPIKVFAGGVYLGGLPLVLPDDGNTQITHVPFKLFYVKEGVRQPLKFFHEGTEVFAYGMAMGLFPELTEYTLRLSSGPAETSGDRMVSDGPTDER